MIYVSKTVRVYNKDGREFAGIVVALQNQDEPRSVALRIRVFSPGKTVNDFNVDVSCIPGEKNEQGFAWQY